MTDRSKRLITLGEPQKDPLRHIDFSPVHHYDEDVEFVSDFQPKRKDIAIVADDKEIEAKKTELEHMIYSLYEIKNDQEKKDFLKGQ